MPKSMVQQKESLGRRSARTFSVLTIGRTVSLLVGIFSIIVIARLLGPSSYGIFTLAYAFFLLITAASNFGFGQYLTKHLSEAEDKKDKIAFSKALSSGFLGCVIVGFLLTFLGIGISGFVASLFPASGITQTILVLASAMIFFSMMYGTSNYALIGAGKNAAAASLEIFENVVLLVVSVALIELGYGVSGAIIGMLVSYIAAGVIGTAMIFSFAHKHMHVSPNWPTLKEVKSAFAFSLPIATNNFLSNSVVAFATLVLGFFVSAYALGNFGIANRARTIVSVFYITAAVTMVPTLTLAIARDEKSARANRLSLVYNKGFVLSILASVPIIAYIGVFSKPLIYLLISTNFSSAPLYLSLISLGTIIGLLGVYATSLFIASGKTSKLLHYSLMYTIIELVALAIMVPLWGVLGAIIALFFVGGIAADYLFLRGTKTVLGLDIDYHKLSRALMSNLALAVIFALGLFAASFAVELVYGLFAMLIAYPFFLVLFKSVDEEDLRIVDDAIQKLPALRTALGPMLAYLNFLERNLPSI